MLAFSYQEIHENAHVIEGNENFIVGHDNIVIGKRNVIVGDHNVIHGKHNLIYGRFNTNFDLTNQEVKHSSRHEPQLLARGHTRPRSRTTRVSRRLRSRSRSPEIECVCGQCGHSEVYPFRAEVQRLGTSTRAREGEAPCILCLTNSKDIAFVPCGHVISCVSCVQELTDRKCPLCRKRVENVYRIFL